MTGDPRLLPHRVQHACGGFGKLDQHACNGGVGGQGLLHLLGAYGPAPGHFQGDDLQAARNGDGLPALAEFARLHHQHLFTGVEQAVHGGGHGARAGAGKGQHRALGAEKNAQLFLHPTHDRFEFAFAVVDHVPGQGQPYALRQGRGTGSEQAYFIEHGKLRDGLGAVSTLSFRPLPVSGTPRAKVEYVEYTPSAQDSPSLAENENPHLETAPKEAGLWDSSMQ